jgi:hypothetical protein
MIEGPDRRGETGPFDIIGDVHGCAGELEALLSLLGYTVEWEGAGPDRRCVTRAPAGRRVVFVGDYVDRGPRSLDTLRIVMTMIGSGQSFGVLGNHDARLVRWLDGRNVQTTHGLADTAEQLQGLSAALRQQLKTFLDNLRASGATCLGAPRLRRAPSAFMATRPESAMSSASPCAATGPRVTAGQRPSFMGTHRF